jgi:uncharacterized protein with NAD-binding domain and iron-sulfur cluster
MTDKNQISRRKFLLGAGAVAGGAVVAGAAVPAVMHDPLLEAAYPEVPENKVELKPNGKTVVILGGGLAGMQAAVELSARGFKTIVLEKSGTPGGKLKTWRDKTFGPADAPEKADPLWPGFVRDHGLHAVWYFYNNLREFLHRYGWGLQDLPEDASIYHFLDKDGTHSVIPTTTWPLPYNFIQLFLGTRAMKHVAEKDRGQLGMLFGKLATFDYTDEKQRAYLDSMTFEEYGRKLGLNDALIHKICDSLLEMAYFDNVDKTSALPLANLMALVAGSPDDTKISLYLDPPGETFVKPMADYVLAHGGEIHYNTEITQIHTDGKRVTGLTAAALDFERLKRCSICGNLIFDGMEIGECPFCGANLDMIKLLTPEEKAARTFTGDYYVSALDIPAAQKFYGENLAALGGHAYFADIAKLHAKSVYVVNMWFDGTEPWSKILPTTPGDPELCFFATGFEHLGITINRGMPWVWRNGESRHHFKDYTGKHVSVIETQIAKAENVATLPKEEIVELCYQELKSVMPDLPKYRSYFVNRWHHYTAYHVGDEMARPPVQSPLDNLLLIGDMAFVPHHAVFMEKTNVTAKWAVNLLLEKAGQAEGKIKILHSGTHNPLLKVLRSRTSVYI